MDKLSSSAYGQVTNRGQALFLLIMRPEILSSKETIAQDLPPLVFFFPLTKSTFMRMQSPDSHPRAVSNWRWICRNSLKMTLRSEPQRRIWLPTVACSGQSNSAQWDTETAPNLCISLSRSAKFLYRGTFSNEILCSAIRSQIDVKFETVINWWIRVPGSLVENQREQPLRDSATRFFTSGFFL